MKPIKHIRSKRGFYIGRLSQEAEKHMNPSKLSSEFVGKPGKGMGWACHQLMTLDGEHQKKKRLTVIDPKGHFHKHFHK
ncbi:hypothetical protein [Bacillus pseudomycoides]|uniref:hypothetical protein n=1 Tax=Bacillus pseudomycoides TaxID=64104 RepID=UPI000BFCB79B|nr:hypothetical protein [Bacillus pseudomycoides]PGE04281.1 hypothetical protein COM49_08825 [Bacillus pseudomycoides]PHG20750.1 hypothetical protein COI47_15995 [Bacillus pseudomycoides]